MVIISDIQLPKDSDGILKVSDVSTSAQGDLSARTDPTNPSTSKFIQADTSNNLGVYLGNAEGAGANNSLNATEYAVVQVGGFDGNDYRSLKVNNDGHLQVDVLSGGGGDATADNQTNGNQKTQILGNTQPDGSGDSHHIHVDANGNVRTSIISSVVVSPADNSNGELSPSKSFNVKDTNITKGENDISAGTGAQQVLIYGKDAFAPFNLEPIRMSSDKVLMTNPNITRGEGNITGGGNGLQQILCYGKDQSGNLDPLNVDSNGHLKITLNDIEAGIVNSINVASKHDNAYLQILSGGSTTIGGTPILTSAHTLSAGAGSVGGKQTITFYISTGSGTSDSNFSYEVHKSYDGVDYFVDSNFTFNPVGSNTASPPAVVAAVVGNGFSDGRFLKVKITNNAEVNATSINVYIIERQ